MENKNIRRRYLPKVNDENSQVKSEFSEYTRNIVTWRVTTRLAIMLLFSARLMSARWNIIHDCDEVYNFWEPAHYLLYGNGKQTWEYSPEFALRSYLYILLHVKVMAVWATFGLPKVAVFFFMRAFLACLSTAAETYLFVAVRTRVGARAAHVLLLLLCVSPGMFCASSALLPSSFTMYCLTVATAATLLRHHHVVVAASAVGALLAWPFAALAVLPLCLQALKSERLRAVKLAVFWFALVVVPQILTDKHYYGRWTFSQWNLLMYNVAGGGSELYGTEGMMFYVKNCLLNFNFIFLFASALPAVMWLSWKQFPWHSEVLAALAPLPLWLGAMCLPAHKEERFLYCVYPTMCLAASCSFAALPSALPTRAPANIRARATKALQRVTSLALVLIVLLSVSRILALVHFYNAPIVVFSSMQTLPATGAFSEPSTPQMVCIGSEWFRFPSSFFLPSPNFRLGFLPSEFKGLLPFDFNGTNNGSLELNDLNLEAGGSYIKDPRLCQFVVQQIEKLDYLSLNSPSVALKGVDGRWKAVAEHKFLDASRSPVLTRALYIPFLGEKKNSFHTYAIFQKLQDV